MPENRSVGGPSVFNNERPAYSIDPPAAVRHLMFRLRSSDSTAPYSEAEQRERSAILRGALSAHLNCIRQAYGSCDELVEIVADASEVTGKFQFLANRSVLVEVEGTRRHGYRLRVRVDIYYELFTVTYLIDQIDRNHGGEIPLQLAKLPRDSEAATWLFDQLWDCDGFPPNAHVREWTKQFADPARAANALGELVADFRTIVLYPRENWHLDEPSLEFRRIAISQETQIAPEILAFASEHQDLVRHVAGARNVGGEPLLCGMAGGQALYVSELGQWGADARAIQPIHLLLIYAGSSHAQIGRLMRRLHVLGELRHAAVLDWDRTAFGHNRDLRTASLKLQELSNRVNTATLETSRAEVDAIVREFAEIGMSVDGGLTYRVERSRSYAASFLDTLPHLRITRVAGWQPYDDFINRYIGLLFGRIHRIGLQYDELGRRIDRLLNKERGNQFEKYQQSIHATLMHLDELTTELRKGADKMQEDAGRHLDLLGNAELFAVIFGVYYVGSILEKALFPEKGHLIEVSFAALGKIIYDGLWFSLAAGLSAWLLYRLLRTRRERLRQEAARLSEEEPT